MVTIRIPAPSSMLVANLLGVLGLIGVVVAIGGLAGWWWALLAGGVFAVGLAVIAQANLAGESAPKQSTAATAAASPGPVAVAPVEEQRSA